MTDDERSIRDVIQRWLTASEAGDLTTVLGLMTEDVVFMTCGEEPFGKAAFGERSRGLDALELKTKSDVLEVVIRGDLAYVRAHLEVTVTPPGADAPVRRAGHTLSIFRKDGDAWLLARDANLLVPAA